MFVNKTNLRTKMYYTIYFQNILLKILIKDLIFELNTFRYIHYVLKFSYE